MHFPAELKVSLFREMLRIHRVQLRIESLYHLDEMKTPVHLSIGQEAVAVGVCAQLHRDDYISSNHRGHAHYLAKGGDLRGLIAELHCRETGCSKGRGGSMHLVDTSVGHLGSSSIVGGGIPIGTGLGLAIKMKDESRVSVVFFGDGAADEGVLYESINFAILHRLPVIFIYENNEYSVFSHISSRQWGKLVFHATPPHRMWTQVVDGNSVLQVYQAAHTAVARARQGQGPSLLECKTYRMRGHAGAGSDVRLGYRSAAELNAWEKRCPVTIFRSRLLAAGEISEPELEALEQAIEAEIDDAFQFAQASSLPRGEDLYQFLFRE